ncbi:MAG: D-alanyl-D-alanine carboxypeptidase [Bacteroidia bacterium]
MGFVVVDLLIVRKLYLILGFAIFLSVPMFSKKSILLGLMVCTPQKSEEKPKEIVKVSISEFNQFIKDLPNQTPLKSANVGFTLMDESGKTTSELQSGNSLAPASVMKVITTASALDILGTDFQFETQLAYTGKVKNGVLKGNLVIIGGGDPTLGSKNTLSLLSKWAGIVKQVGNLDSKNTENVFNA